MKSTSQLPLGLIFPKFSRHSFLFFQTFNLGQSQPKLKNMILSFLQLRVIDSHPYENVDGDGRPLCHNEEEITPDYETIFVKQTDEEEKERAMKNAGDIDVILSQRMSQKSVVDGNASPPPQPPPKQRTPIETGAIDSRKLPATLPQETSESPTASLNRSNNDSLLLFEPPLPNVEVQGTQKIKKGDLKLTQMENGSWRLEDSDKQVSAAATTTTTTSTTTTSTPTTTSIKVGGKKKKSKDQSNDESSEQQLLRRPSIKKIRALFQKDSNKESSKSADGGETEESKEVLAAISKLPKFEPYGNLIGKSESTRY